MVVVHQIVVQDLGVHNQIEEPGADGRFLWTDQDFSIVRERIVGDEDVADTGVKEFNALLVVRQVVVCDDPIGSAPVEGGVSRSTAYWCRPCGRRLRLR